MAIDTDAKIKEEYIFSFYDQMERDNDPHDIIYSEHQRINDKEKMKDYANDVYGTVYVDKIGPIPEMCVGIECFADFVDLDILEQTMSKYDLKLPNYIFFVKPNMAYEYLGVSGWTPSSSRDKIYINIELYRFKDEIPVVEAIAHEAWHLEKQPRFIRTIPGLSYLYERKTYSISDSVSELYKKMKEVKTALDMSVKWR